MFSYIIKNILIEKGDINMTNFTEKQHMYDPEFTDLMDRFIFEETADSNNIDKKTRYLAILAALIACQGGSKEYRQILPIAIDEGVTPVEAKEVLYQACAYLGLGRVYPFIDTTNEVFEKLGIKLPLEQQGTTDSENRREKGTEKQIELFGPNMKDFWKASDINLFLADNCFGDYYTRNGLNNAQRELITFCYIAAQGGCEPQLIAHSMANFKQGNSKEFLINIVSHLVPFLGYPRSLNAIAAVNKADENLNK